MKRKYLSKLIDRDFVRWRGKKVIIQAPTGCGKSTFIIRDLLAYCQEKKRKMLILCNRRMLRKQYWYQLTENFQDYRSLQNSVTIVTYQELAERLRVKKSLDGYLAQFDVICLDECHYFYQDSDFNGFGTFVLFQALVLGGLGKNMIFLTATADWIIRTVRETYSDNRNFFAAHYPTLADTDLQRLCEVTAYDYSFLADYDYLNCFYVPDMETLCRKLVNTPAKSILFIDDIKKASEIKEGLVNTGLCKESDVVVLNADNLNDADEKSVVKTLALANRLEPKILITTSVLDNGVSVHDSEVENVVILTESKVSFLQMLGRLRVENVSNVNLYFLAQPASYYQRRELQYERLHRVAKTLTCSDIDNAGWQIIDVLLQGDEEDVAAYRSMVVATPSNLAFLRNRRGKFLLHRGDFKLAMNLFAVDKINDLYMTESAFHKLARCNPIEVAKAQMQWIGKEPHELTVLSSDYKEELEEQLRNELLQIQGYTVEEMKQFKLEISSKYAKDLFGNIVDRKRSFSNEKLEMILPERSLKLITETGEDNRMRYSVKEVVMNREDAV